MIFSRVQGNSIEAREANSRRESNTSFPPAVEFWIISLQTLPEILMQNVARLAGFGLFTLLLVTIAPIAVRTQPTKGIERYWIWSPGATLSSAPDGSQFFRRAFDVKGSVKDASLEITCDNHFTVWINGKLVGNGDTWQQMQRFDVAKTLIAGKNIIAVEGRNDGTSPAGLLATLTFTDDDGRKSISTDKTWKTTESVSGDKWKAVDFDDAKWEAAKQLAPFGQGPWGSTLNGGGSARQPAKRGFTVPEGFKVETVVAPGTVIEGETNAKYRISFVNMCFDAKGRLLLSQEGGPIVLASEPNKDGVFQKLLPYCEQVTNCQGMCWAHDALYLVGNGPKGTGLYRCGDTKKADKIDDVEQLVKFQGGMGEHGPHAVIHGPDDKLYVVVGNHAWLPVTKLADNSPLKRWPDGLQGPDQGKPGTTEDVLLPRLNDANGHAANIRAPGGTIWRMDLDGKNPALFSAGFRNQFDAAFNPDGELFTFDSDMEWDEGLPWYRHVRVCHCTPGADFVWRTGAANTPNYYADSLPPMVETGRGSPTGVECYDHSAFPSKYRGALFLCDWSIGTIWVVFPKRDGATYKATHEKFCSGSPMPVSDCAVGPDGALYFTLGGRGTAGSVHRIVHEAKSSPIGATPKLTLFGTQPLAAYRRSAETTIDGLIRETDDDAEKRARQVYFLGIRGGNDSKDAIVKALADADAQVRRRACEACIRLGIEVDVKNLKPLLADNDPFVRTSARLLLQRIDAAKWAKDLLAKKGDNRVALQAIIALSKINKASDYHEIIFERLDETTSSSEPSLEFLRTLELALVHCQHRPTSVLALASDCLSRFPKKDKLVNRELAILLAEFARSDELRQGVVGKLMAALRESADDRPQQIHYFYCMRVIKDGWSAEQKKELLAWFENTKSWTGGASYNGFLQNILRDMLDVWSPAERRDLIAQFEKMPLTALVMLRNAPSQDLPAPGTLYRMFKQVAPNLPKANELKSACVDAIARSPSREALPALKQIADGNETAYKLAAIRAFARNPAAEVYPYLLQALSLAPGASISEFLDALKMNMHKPKPEDGKDYRAVLASASKLQGEQKWKVVEVLRYWTNGRSFGGDKKSNWKSELAAWGKWFAQAYPKEESLPDVSEDRPPESKWKYADLIAYLEKDPRGSKGDVMKGKAIFTKANCIKCHKYGNEGEGIGPDLTTLSKRFKRGEILESILSPSKVISDQYRSSTILTQDGRSFIGLAAEQGGTITILLQDGSKTTIKASDVEARYASLVSVMPEKLLDELTKEEIADLFAYTESTPPDKE
jgi:putative heme-binding domain-containing protein